MSQPAPQPRSAVKALPGYVAGRRAQSALTEPLASNESHFLPDPTVLAAIASAAVRANRYPDMASLTLRERLAEINAVDVAEIAVGPGSVGVLSQLIGAVCDPGDEVIFAWRSFEAYPILCQLAGANAVQIPLTEAETHDLPAMAAAVGDATKVILLCTPNNPTGTSIATDELRAFLNQVPDTVLVVLDEAYREYSPRTAPDSMALYREYPNLCLLRTFSKAYGLAGLRVGYAIAKPDLAEGLRRTQVPFSVSAVAESAAVAALGTIDEVTKHADEIARERDRVIAAARDLGWTVPDSTANFIWLRLDDQRREQLMAAFDHAEILVRAYPGDGIRITVAGPIANDRVLTVLRAQRELAASPRDEESGDGEADTDHDGVPALDGSESSS
jgi:histidinol-phosphate aminotransferase